MTYRKQPREQTPKARAKAKQKQLIEQRDRMTGWVQEMPRETLEDFTVGLIHLMTDNATRAALMNGQGTLKQSVVHLYKHGPQEMQERVNGLLWDIHERFKIASSGNQAMEIGRDVRDGLPGDVK